MERILSLSPLPGFGNHTDKFWKNVRSYNGDDIDVPENDTTPCAGEFFYRDMTPFERRLYTLFSIKCEERDQMILYVCGQHPRSVTSLAMRTLFVKDIQDHATPQQKKDIISLWKLADEFKNGIFEFIGHELWVREPNQFYLIKLRPGNKILLSKNTNQSTIRDWHGTRGMGKMPKHFF